MRIRRGTMADAAAIAVLTEQLGYQATTGEIEERLGILLAQATQFIAVAEIDGEVAGWIAAEYRVLLELAPRVEIMGLVVSREHRRAGLGRALVAAVAQWQNPGGVSTLVVRSNVIRPESHSFYQGLGFQLIKTQHVYRKDTNGDRID